MCKVTSSPDGIRRTAPGCVTVLVVSQHETVRCQLVANLSRSGQLVVTGALFSPDAINRASPDVLILDLSQLGSRGLSQALEAAHHVGANVIALASLRVPADERAVVESGGLYRLKSAGADGLADVIHAAAARPAISGQPSEA